MLFCLFVCLFVLKSALFFAFIRQTDDIVSYFTKTIDFDISCNLHEMPTTIFWKKKVKKNKKKTSADFFPLAL